MPVRLTPGNTESARAIGVKTVLVIDDSEATSNAIARLLRGAGYNPIAFQTGHAALDYATEKPTPFAAIVDIHLPDISGLIVSQKLRETFGSDTPIIVLSGDTSMQTLNSLTHVGATYFYSKPVNGTQLLGRLENPSSL